MRRPILLGTMLCCVLVAAGTPSSAGIRPQPFWQVEGEFDRGYLGAGGVAFGDFNGDGFRDIAVSAYGGFGSTIAGKVYVYVGSATGLSQTPDWTAVGDEVSSGFGFGQVGFGDFNGDTYTDLALGAPFRNGNRGAVYLWYGGPAGPGNPSGLGPNGTTANADWSRLGSQAGEQLGFHIGKAGDVNGDGREDFMAGSPQYSGPSASEGKVQLWHGSATGLGTGAPNWTAESNQANARFGHRFHDGHDINGDDFDDVIISAECYEEPANSNECGGRAFVYLGSATGLGAAGTPANADWRAFGEAGETQYSYWVSALDFNGDHYSDVMVGNPTSTVNGVQYGGRVLIWFGGPPDVGNPTGLGPTGTNANADWQAQGTEEFHTYGFICETAGDVNGDGYEDLLNTNFNWSPNETTNRGGAVWAWHAGPSVPTGTAANATWKVIGTAVDQQVGGNAHTVRDVNGDGFADVFLASAGPSAVPYAGRVELYAGACGSVDADGDGLAPTGTPGCAADDDTDCDDANGAVWEGPGEATALRSGATKDDLVWDAAPPGGSVAAPVYDTLRAASPDGFGSATCVESDGADMSSTDATLPAPGAAFYYLVRAVNACPGASGEGSLGRDSDGNERIGLNCP